MNAHSPEAIAIAMADAIAYFRKAGVNVISQERESRHSLNIILEGVSGKEMELINPFTIKITGEGLLNLYAYCEQNRNMKHLLWEVNHQLKKNYTKLSAILFADPSEAWAVAQDILRKFLEFQETDPDHLGQLFDLCGGSFGLRKVVAKFFNAWLKSMKGVETEIPDIACYTCKHFDAFNSICRKYAFHLESKFYGRENLPKDVAVDRKTGHMVTNVLIESNEWAHGPCECKELNKF